MRAAGFTMVETLIVVAVVGLVMAMGYPRLQGAWGSANLRAARVQLSGSLAVARAAAIRFGRPAEFKRNGNSIEVRADTAGTGVFLRLLAPVPLDSTFGVTLGATVDSVVFGGRGLASNLGTAGAKFSLVHGSLRDSVCVTRLGQVPPLGCR